MHDKTTPVDGEAPEQEFSDVPGPSLIIPEGRYKIYTSLNNTSVVDMALYGAPHAVKLWPDNNEPESTWNIRYEPRVEAHRINNGRYPHLYLYVVNYSEVYASDPPNPLAAPYNWLFKSTGNNNEYFIESVYTRHVLEVKDSSTATNTPIIDLPYKAASNQRFKLVRQ